MRIFVGSRRPCDADAFATVFHEPGLLHGVQVLPVVPLGLGCHELGVGELGVRAALGAEESAKILGVEVIEGHVVDVLGQDAQLGELTFERVEALGHEPGQALAKLSTELREEGRRGCGVDVRGVEEQMLELPFLEKLHEQCPVRHGDEGRRRKSSALERVARGVWQRGERQRAHGEALGACGELGTELFGGAAYGPQLHARALGGPGFVEDREGGGCGHGRGDSTELGPRSLGHKSRGLGRSGWGVVDCRRCFLGLEERIFVRDSPLVSRFCPRLPWRPAIRRTSALPRA